MNDREKILVYLVGGLMVVLGLHYSFQSYQTALKVRENKLRTVEEKLQDQRIDEFAGAEADNQLYEYSLRSLPSDKERAQAEYKEWLEELVVTCGFAGWNVDFNGAQGSNSLYNQYAYHVTGLGNIQEISEFLEQFHAKNYLQRLKKVTLRRAGEKGDLLLDVDIQAMALASADEDQAAPKEIDPRVIDTGEALITAVINRNMFSPPNQAPRYEGSPKISAFLGKDFASKIRFKDPDGDKGVDLDVEGDLPPGLQLNRGEIIGKPKEKGEYKFTVIARDRGLPVREVSQSLMLTVGDPPPEVKEVVKGPPPFDESRQAILTGLVQSRGQWTAWINIRTKGELLKLKSGDDFEVGTVAGKVVEVNSRYVVMESDGTRFTMKQDSSLADAKSAKDEAL